jgi:hypothetical protein
MAHVFFCLALGNWCLARQEAQPSAPISIAQTQITEGKVRAAISFLASDELAGRATGTTEFNIAAAYVATRFQGAGLTGGSDGGFYHETAVKMIQTPSDAELIQTSPNAPALYLGLMAATSEGIEVESTVAEIDLANIPEKGLSPIVSGRFAGDSTSPRVMSSVARLSSRLSQAGAKLLLLRVPRDSDILRLAKQSRETPRLDSPQSRFALPVLLISDQNEIVGPVRVRVPANVTVEQQMRNVIGLLPGTDPQLAREAVLFSAHLDHLGRKPESGDGIMNGADDDASGVTAVLMLADAFGASPPPKRTVLFMTFWGEESGLLGSRQFTATPSWPLEQIVANVNIEMIGRPEPGAQNKIWMTGWRESNLGPLMREAARPFGIEIFEHPSFSARLYRSSDNWSFVEKGVVAHSFSAGSLHSDYHGPDDEWEKLELPHMTKVIQGLYYGALPLVNGAQMPTKTK